MFRNIYKKILFLFFSIIYWVSYIQTNASWKDYINIRYGGGSWAWSSSAPSLDCYSLPWCKSSWWSWVDSFIINFLDKFIQLVAVIAVFSLIFSWILYMLSSGEEEKANRAKKWIIWSLVWVLLSTLSFSIILLINNISFK